MNIGHASSIRLLKNKFLPDEFTTNNLFGKLFLKKIFSG
jgi:hypothetical protein